MGRSVEFLVLASVALAVGCVPPRAASPSPFGGGMRESHAVGTDVAVEVRNEHWLPMRVWVEWPQMRRFLGEVAPGSATVFLVPAALARRFGEIRLYADPTGSIDEVRTEPIDVRDGHRVEWRVRRVLANSRARVI